MSVLLRHVLLLQRDVPAAAKFYTEGLGLVAHVCTDRWAELGDASSASSSSDPPRTLIALQAVDGEAHRSTGYSPILNFTVTDLDATVNSLLRAGATLDGPSGTPREAESPRSERPTDTCSASTNPPRRRRRRRRRRRVDPHRPARPRTRSALGSRPIAPHTDELVASTGVSSPRRGISQTRASRRRAALVAFSRASRLGLRGVSVFRREGKRKPPPPPAGERRVILHADADAFFCQVERLRDPSLARAPRSRFGSTATSSRRTRARARPG